MMTISQTDFDHIRRSTPLISIDLIIETNDGDILLGRRRNEPACDKWFVPGGRVRKDEKISDAFRRIVNAELGDRVPIASDIDSAHPCGVFEHIYPATEHSAIAGSVHYVVLGHRILTEKFDLANLPTDQHSEWQWLSENALHDNSEVHVNTKKFFERSKIHEDQYDVVAQRRVSYDSLLWQTPVLGLTAQAFLFTIAFSEIRARSRFPACILVVAVSIACLQLMAKHRAYEVRSSSLLVDYERKTSNFGGGAWEIRRQRYCV